MVGYIFGGNSGNSYESLQRKRQTADLIRRQLMGEKPKTALEGVAALLKGAAVGIGDYRTQKEMDEKTQASVDGYNQDIQSIMTPQSGSGTPSMAQAIMQGKPINGGSSPITGGGSYRDAIASIESAGSGDYSAIGPTNAKMGRPLGRYQIMEANIGPWSKEALGREVTPDEFLKNPQLQDAVFDHQFQGYVEKYGPEGAAQAWLGGPGSVGKTNRKDVLGTPVGEYGRRFMNAYGGGREVASLDPSAGMGQPQNAAQAIEAQAPMGGSSLSDEAAAFRATPEYAAQFPGQQPQQPAPQMQPPQVGGLNPFAANGQQQQAPVEMAGGGGRPATFGPQQVPQSSQFNPYEGISPELIQRLSDPFLPPEMKQSLQGLIDQRMRANQQSYEEQMWRSRLDYQRQQQMSDPDYQLGLEAKRAQIEALQAKPQKQWQRLDDNTLFNPESGETRSVPIDPNAGPSDLGLNPQYGVDANGNPVLLQLGKDGRTVQSKLPDGITLSKEPIKLDAGTHFVLLDPITRQAVGQIAKDNRAEAADKAGGAEGKAQAEASTGLTQAVADADQSIALIDAMITHPGRANATGLSSVLDPRNYLAGTNATDFNTRSQQLQGRAFLQAFNSLRGGGQITEIEGRKATEAIARLNTSQSEDAYLGALKELKGILEVGKDRARQKAGAPSPASAPGHSSPPSAAPAAADPLGIR